MACSQPIIKPFQAPVQQGNVITDDMTKKLKVGMSKQQVADIFGTPVLNNPFESDTWLYIYTLQPSKGPYQKKRLIVYFRNDRVSSYNLDLPVPDHSKPIKKAHRFKF